jgi:hypothetical protein
MLWHGLVDDPNTMRPRQGSAVLRLLPGERFFSVFILKINPHKLAKIVVLTDAIYSVDYLLFTLRKSDDRHYAPLVRQ